MPSIRPPRRLHRERTSTIRGSRRSQRGATILIALILLLSLAIAAVATVRSSDSSVLVAGNVAVRMDAVNQAELGVAAGVEMARQHLRGASANSNQPARNYVAAPLPVDAKGIPNALAGWSDPAAGSLAFRGTYTAPAVPTRNDVIVNYLVERMCDPLVSGESATREFCHVALDLNTRSGSNNLESTGAQFDEAVVFRVTVRVDQPNQSAPTFAQEYFSVY